MRTKSPSRKSGQGVDESQLSFLLLLAGTPGASRSLDHITTL